jgi:hypothetical protein
MMFSLEPRRPLTADEFRRAVGALRGDPPRLADVVARAEALLCAWLTPDQRTCYEQFGTFDVIGSASGKRYRIGRGAIYNIRELDAHGDTVYGWCFVPAVRLASADEMLAQKIALETSERETLRVANREPPRLRDIAREFPQLPIGAILSSLVSRACHRILTAIGRSRSPTLT